MHKISRCSRSAIAWEAFRFRYEKEVLASLARKTGDMVSCVFNVLETILPIIKTGLLRDLTAERLSEWQTELRNRGRSEATIAGHCAHLRAALAWAVDQGLLTELPKIRKPKRARGSGGSDPMKGRPITGEEFERMIVAVPKALTIKAWNEEARKWESTPPTSEAVESWRQLLYGLWWSGLRLGEALSLYWDRPDRLRVDLTDREPMLHIPGSMQNSGKDQVYAVAPEFAELLLSISASRRHGRVAVRDLINQMKTSKDPNYCQRVTANDGTLGEQHLRDFQDNEKIIPTILTTSQKLSTGVDARNIRNIVLMRPINSMIEFKQIIGRGTRIYDGKDYFTIYDFVKAHHHFNDPEWDGEPLEPEPCPKCHRYPCECEKKPPQPCPNCGKRACICIKDPCPRCGQMPCVCKKRAKVKLADGKERDIQHMMVTSFWHSDGTPISSQQFLQMLFGKLPEFFKNEAELRSLWSAPDTRSQLLQGLAEKGFGPAQMAEMQKIIDAEKSDLFDVLAYVAYALPTLTREERAARAKLAISTQFNSNQQAFLNFVLAQYVSQGVQELDQEKLSPLLRLKYNNSIADALADLGRPEEIGEAFAGFQKFLYQEAA